MQNIAEYTAALHPLKTVVDNLEMINDLFERNDELLHRYIKNFSYLYSSDGEHIKLIEDSRERFQAIQKEFEFAARVIEGEA